MKSLISKLVAVVAVLIPSINVMAYDFELDGLLYTITSISELTVSFDGIINSEVNYLSIPEQVSYNGRKLTVTEIKSSALEGNTIIKDILLPATITKIGSDAFRNSNIRTIELPDGLTYLGSGAFKESKIESIKIPESVTKIYESCFKNCKELHTVYLPSSLKKVSLNAFQGCEMLNEVRLPSKLDAIEGEAFADCSSLKEFIIPNSVTFLAYSAIRNCTNLEKLVVGSGLVGFDVYLYGDESFSSYRFNYEAFAKGCTSLKSIIIADSKKNFSIKGQFNSNESVFKGDYNNWIGEVDIIPAFANCSIDYYYCGRPLIDITNWKQEYTRYLGDGKYNHNNIARISIGKRQPYGHIRTLEIAGECEYTPFFYQKLDSLKLGSNVSMFDANNLYLDSIQYIRCEAMNPPVLSGNIPKHILLNIPLYVKSGCKSKYEQANGWKEFWNIIEDAESGISDVQSETTFTLHIVDGKLIIDGKKDADMVFVYNMYGHLVSLTSANVINLRTKGIYLIKIGSVCEKILL